MTPDAVDRLRAEAARDDYASMARLARALYGTGLGPREVLRECYGVAFPDEVFAIAEGGLWRLRLLALFTNQPWQLAVPPGRGGPAAEPDGLIDTELRLLAGDLDLMPLVRVPAADPGREDRIVCYRLSELRAGRSTVFRLFESSAAESALACGISLLEVLHAEHTASVRRLEKELRSPSNWGAGSVDDDEVDRAYASLERVEALQRRVSERLAEGQGDAGG
ncbi:hypothetical protein GCM10017744_011340 [Streptomyces antimycoticus]|uniref:Uncharacterized protein n=1 Tax=Streptomyces antimycoticus TaxID=68175 RepID=A0A4D4KGH0_9ACTN|nr:hypothetical protein [Streptomyces antimycoticus]GDY48055.1 hypothetical protein SANT12839_089370 [Streptomyces antimycoticus]